MLEKIRKSTKSVYILFIFGAIILVFIFWGIGPMGKGNSDEVASVDGSPVTIKQYLNMHRRLVDYYRRVYGERFTPQMERELNLENEAINILINRNLAVNEAKRRGVTASDEEVKEAIAAIPAFRKDGAFDTERYFQALKRERITPAEFEEAVRKDIIAEKIRKEVVKDIRVSPEEVEKAYLKEMRKVNLSYIKLKPSSYLDGVEVSDEDAKNYLKENSTDFIEPARIKVLHAYVDYGDLRVKVTGAEIKAYYEKNKDSFMTPEKVRARHILIRPDYSSGDKKAAEEKARTKAESILKKIKAGADFTALAKKYSADPGSAKKGGDLGWFPRGVMVKPFEDAAFSLGKGEVSGLVKTPFGFHIIKVEGRKKPRPRSLKEVRAEIKKTLRDEKARDLAEKTMQTLAKSLKEAKSEEDVKKALAEARGVRFRLTGFFSSDVAREALPEYAGPVDDLFIMDPGEVAGPSRTHGRIFLVKLIKRMEARLPEYKEIAPKVKEAVRQKKARLKAREEAEKLLGALKGGATLKGLAAKKNLNTGETGYFSLASGVIPALGVPVATYRDIFDLNREKPVYPRVLESEKAFYVVALKGEKAADLKALTPELRKRIEAGLLTEKQDRALNEWIDGLRKKAKIYVYRERM